MVLFNKKCRIFAWNYPVAYKFITNECALCKDAAKRYVWMLKRNLYKVKKLDFLKIYESPLKTTQ